MWLSLFPFFASFLKAIGASPLRSDHNEPKATSYMYYSGGTVAEV
jgi:hypothetical protein